MRIHWLLLTLVLSFSTGALASSPIRCETSLLAQAAAPSELVIDAKDVATIISRKSWIENLVAAFRQPGEDVRSADIDSQLAFLKGNQSFRHFFKVKDSIARDLEERNDPFDAQVKSVEGQADGLRAKIEMIRQAKHTIDLTYFIFKDDDTGLAILHELKEAVRRGVRVRLLVDGIGTFKQTLKGNPHFKALLQDAAKNAGFMTDDNGRPTNVKASIEIVLFNPVSSLLTVNRRMHDKFMVIDAMYPRLAMGLLGGRNIGDDYHTPTDADGRSMLDYETIVKNALGSEITREKDVGKVLNDYFERLYFHDTNRKVARDLLASLWAPETLLAMASSAEKVTSGNFSLNDGFYAEQWEFVSTIQNILRRNVLRNFGSPDRLQAPVNGMSLTRRQRELFLQASATEAQTGQAEHATLVSPYLTLTPQEMKLMIKWLAANRKRKLTMMTSTILTTNQLAAQILVEDGLAKFTSMLKDAGLSDQVEIYCYGHLDDKEFGGVRNYGTLHEKLFMLEQARITSSGTYNYDPRSLLLNSESSAILRGENSYAARARHVDGLISDSVLYDSPEWHEMRARATGSKASVVKFQSRYYQALKLFGLWYMI